MDSPSTTAVPRRSNDSDYSWSVPSWDDHGWFHVCERNRATNGFERWKDGVSLFLERLADDRAVTVPSAASRA